MSTASLPAPGAGYRLARHPRIGDHVRQVYIGPSVGLMNVWATLTEIAPYPSPHGRTFAFDNGMEIRNLPVDNMERWVITTPEMLVIICGVYVRRADAATRRNKLHAAFPSSKYQIVEMTNGSYAIVRQWVETDDLNHRLYYDKKRGRL